MITQIVKNEAGQIAIDTYKDGELTNATSISLSITNPSGTEIIATASPAQGPTVGHYTYQVAADKTTTAGIYIAEWTYTMSGETRSYTHTQYFEVVENSAAVRQGYVTPTYVRDNAVYDKITDASPADAILQKYIKRSTRMIDKYLGDSIEHTQYAEEIRCVLDKIHNGVHIQLRHRPITDVVDIVLKGVPESLVRLDVAYVRRNDKAGYLEYFSDISIPTLRVCILDPTATHIIPVAMVNLVAGYATIPDDVKLATVLFVEGLYKVDQGEDLKLRRFTLGDQTEAYGKTKEEEAADAKLGFEGASAITALLNKYRQPMRSGFITGPLG